MKVVVTGASGLIGSALVPALRAEGHEVTRLVRRDPRAADEARWDPAAHEVDPGVLPGADAVVHLAGVGVGDSRWSAAHKRAVLRSRVDGTTTISEALARTPDGPRVLVSSSAIGWYGDTGEATVDESGARGQGFLADVVEQWEQATAAAERAGVRVVRTRTGVVLSPAGGALGRVLPLFRFGLGARLGSGQQWMSWVALPDLAAAMLFLLTADDVRGPVNVTAPHPVRNRDYTRAVGRALHRPTPFMVPRFALRVALGDFADEGLLVSQRVAPARLAAAGFRFAHPDIDSALRALL